MTPRTKPRELTDAHHAGLRHHGRGFASVNMKHIQRLSALLLLCASALSQAQGLPASPNYEGHYESGCTEVAAELYTRDVMVVGPGQQNHRVRYAKALYDPGPCDASGFIGLLELPEGTWKLEKKRTQNQRLVDLVAVVLPRGMIRITHAREGRIEETPDSWLIRTQNGEKVTVEKEAAMSSDLDLRWLSADGLLHVGQAQGPRGTDGYLQDLDLENPLKRLDTPSYLAPKTPRQP
jgi:hypothetical protein